VTLFEEMVKLTKRKKKAIVGSLALIFTSPSISSGIPFVGSEILKKVYNPRHGRGYGAPGHKRAKHKRRKPVDVWGMLQQFGDKNFESLTRMYLDEFKVLLDEVAHLENDHVIKNVATRLSFENKVLCLFLWIVKYCDYPVLSFLFGSSNAVMSGLITTLLPYLAGYFICFIPNAIESDLTSSLSSSIVGVIDSTIHARTKSAKNQHHDYSKHYERHGMMTNLLVDFDAKISVVVTNGKSILHDSMASFFMRSMVKVLGPKFALADTGYSKVPFVVCGLTSNHVNSDEKMRFDTVSREEQKVVEHVNNFIKKCKVLSKRNQFIHSRNMQVCCVFLVCGWYNWMKEKFNKFNYR
jgi:hypothetical protein